MIRAQRQNEIANYLTANGFASISDLGKMFNVSEMTIRRDLDDLENRGLFQRTYGGALASETAFFEMAYRAKSQLFNEEKERIGKAASELVSNGETVILDSGSTTTQIARFLKNSQITVITTALNIATELANSVSINLLVAGGMLRKATLGLVGPQTDTFFKSIRADKLFMGVEGVDIFGGFTVPDLINAQTKKNMAASARQIIVVADHSKIGRNTMSNILPLEAAQLLITGKEASTDLIEQIRQYLPVQLV